MKVILYLKNEVREHKGMDSIDKQFLKSRYTKKALFLLSFHSLPLVLLASSVVVILFSCFLRSVCHHCDTPTHHQDIWYLSCLANKEKPKQTAEINTHFVLYCISVVPHYLVYDNRDNSHFAARKKEKQGGRSVGWRSHLSHDQARSISLWCRE